MATLEEVLQGNDLQAIFRSWEETHQTPEFDPVPFLRRLSEIFEEQTEIYMRKDPDPFDERHPSRTDPECELGRSLKLLFRKDHFMTKLVNDYLRDNFYTRQSIQKSSLDLNIAACRLILVIMPGLETSAVFQVESQNLLNRVFSWAEDSIEPLQSYATGLLAAAMEVNDMAVTFRELNARLVPKMLKRLHMLQAISKSREVEQNSSGSATSNGLKEFSCASNLSALIENENSHDTLFNEDNKFKKFLIPIYPATTATSQMLILRYLASLGDYQEVLGPVFEHNAIQIIFNYIENIDVRDTCLAFEALKYLASLLCHKKFALEFIARGGLERLLKVPRPSVAATGVSITIYYLAYCEEAMERICAMSNTIVSDLVKYALWLLSRSHDSGKCHATMFFGLSYQFKIILDEFDNQDGLRKLYNVISVLSILSVEGSDVMNDDEECAARQLVRHVCVALKRYMESHLFFKYNQVMRQQCPTSDLSVPSSKAVKSNLEQISEQIRNLQEIMPFKIHWAPVDQLQKLGGIALIVRIIVCSYDWNHSGSFRAETVRSALDVLSMCCVVPRVFLTFCDRLELPDNSSSAGINAILGAAIGEIVTDTEVQKSALAVLVHCVCAPINKPILTNRVGSVKRKLGTRLSEEFIEKIWESVCSNNGIIVLLQLMQIKTPITDADCIRGMACRALAGLARSERVRQIIGKLPLFANGQIQNLMRDPILQEKRVEHVIFQKYAIELLERVSGKSKPVSNIDASLANIHKANVVAQTRIQYNEKQLYQLIYDHLESKGMHASAQILQKEAGLNSVQQHTKNFHQSPFNFKTVPNMMQRSRHRPKAIDLNTSSSAAIENFISPDCLQSADNSFNFNGMNSSYDQSLTEELSTVTPIKLKKMNQLSTINQNLMSSTAHRSLQKQIDPIEEPFHHSRNINDTQSPRISLSTIVTEYLTNQHALCNNPMSTCPQFDLFIPHKCPDPRSNRVLGLDYNVTARLFKSQSGYNTMRLDRRYVHSSFRLWRTIRTPDYPEHMFSCCDIMPCSNLVIAGTQSGEAKIFNINEGVEECSVPCHNSSIDNIKSNKAGNLVITSCSWRSPLSILWAVDKRDFNIKLSFDDEFYCEFSNLNQDKILGTKGDAATIYDLTTGQIISAFTATISNQYTRNRATFCPTDELILSDGVLWDVRSGKEIHKFDKLNQTLSGVFHPNGLEIISNTEVWDLRSFHLLQTVSVLDQCLIKFSPQNVAYGINFNNADDLLETQTGFDTSFKVLDSYDYSSISTIDVKRNIYDISVNKYGSYISLIENSTNYSEAQESFIKIYAVGVRKSDEEEEDDELESEEESDSDDSRVFNIDEIGIGNRRRRRNAENNEENDDGSDSWDDWETDSDSPNSDDEDDNNDDESIVDLDVDFNF